MKKLIGIFISAILLLSCMTVIAENNTAEAAAERLKDLGIITGDSDGNLRLGDSLTRAEMTAIICRLQGKAKAPNKATVFSDVPESHWASGYIDAAYQAGIVNGNDDGAFRPDDKVTYGDVAKMLTTLSGYGERAQYFGGYPRGYLFAASTNGTFGGLNIDVDKDGDKICSRGEMMIMTSNAVDVPLEVQTGDRSIIMDGTNYPLQTIGTTYLGL